MEDLADMCVPGDQVTICGTVKAIDNTNIGALGSGGSAGGSSSKDKCTFVLYISVNSINKNRETSSSSSNQSENNESLKGELQLDFSTKDMDLFKDIKAESDVFKYVHRSKCHFNS